ncbi:3'(2'),5'-bisphosphate nucleotidase CysQ [Oleiphilus sp. HI0081]|uniref:3'(2'),5'-bisphosphate nucleotidase CysQ n=3 Tax=Oleiphilus TaxID=141450 RepID=UPI0007C363D9|nr:MULTISPECIES: 3'(2'),5'-bisphosphate nucleotidase CysQ [unclassified Oleiphilus]KZY51532.1 3'(2'),5'-bisphosphate nucleotidase CysQ [Oleiphilus sp. HI0050]KZY86641.1 3'(2'),5'-bisphosphate nucleotidase CysQ [Oleiphilus sp. HI0072]KZZ22517.1 3'(2'),5'-bisphosphate nucleotidase CysQ [Oleiphilus sp. HI0081]KZY29109.1 3'(2'),5'-bisphosphate nucleotidase CysQ [Oleiphilus sp. HI0043]KZZ30881.1 3'(2'),5'-bisphosphate nucleotidase CysQ [Oleiphilus sp. HI0086]
MNELVQLLPDLKKIVIDAGEAILEVYNSDSPIEVENKADDSPVTKADHAAHMVIDQGLTSLALNYPVLSEEGGMPQFSERSSWQRYWLVDPLDGTKEFINKNGEFTVNIALIEDGEAILGLVYVPVTQTLYYGLKGQGAWKEEKGAKTELKVSAVNTQDTLAVVGSRRHGAEALDELLKHVAEVFDDINLVSMGSSLKICAIAEGTAHWYPRLALTSEWDTAAAHAVLNAAGGEILDIDLKPLTYNQKADILNPFFHALGDQSFDWKALIQKASN